MSFRVEKVSSTIKTAVAEIFLNKMSDPDLKLLTVSNVILSKDLKIAKILVSSLSEDPDKLIKKLENAKGYIRHELSRSVYLKFVPDLRFIFDEGYDFDQRAIGTGKE